MESIDTAAVRTNWRCCDADPAEQWACEHGAMRCSAWRIISLLCDALDAERTTVERTRAVLRRLEWAGARIKLETRTIGLCLECGNTEIQGHTTGCGLDDVLNPSPGARGAPTEPSEGGKGV